MHEHNMESVNEDGFRTELTKFNVNAAAIHSLEQQFYPLEIKDIQDKEGYLAVYEARQKVKKMRVSVDKAREELVKKAVAFQRDVNSQAKELIEPLQKLEKNLQEKESAYDAEKERIKQEKEIAEQIKLQGRVNQLIEFGMVFDGGKYVMEGSAVTCDLIRLKNTDDDIFSLFLDTIRKEYIARQEYAAELIKLKAQEEERIAKERAEQEELRIAENARIEEERRVQTEILEKMRAEQEAERQRLQAIADEQGKREAELKAIQDKLEAEKAAIEAARRQEEQAKAREQGLDRARQEAAQKALQDERDKLERERLKREQEQEKAAAELVRQEALEPDKEKLRRLIDDVERAIECCPYPKSKSAIAVVEKARKMFLDVCQFIETEANKL